MNKKAFNPDQTILTRALNSAKQNYFPTYLGLRMIGAKLSPNNQNYIRDLIIRRIKSNDSWRFTNFSLYKGSQPTSDGVKHVYRDCLAPSPITSLAESIILSKLASSKSFSTPERAYSYRWPASPHSGSDYQYFVADYHQRNAEISNLLKRSSCVAVITDIKSFYPSTNAKALESVLISRLAAEDIRPWREPILNFFSQLLSHSPMGIPIGPASSHALGHLALERVDMDFENEYGQNYFRYVDDIVVVCELKDRKAVEENINLTLEKHGFSPNAEKTEFVDGLTWENYMVNADIDDQHSFRMFASDLVVYLALHPDRATELRLMFAENGLSIPVQRLLALSKYSRYRYFLKSSRTRTGLRRVVKNWFSSNKNLLQRALLVKQAYEERLKFFLNEPVVKSPGTRRWQVQRIKRLVNALFYLRSFEEWVGAEAFDLPSELIEQRALAAALKQGTVNPVLPFYGRGPAAFSELWSEYGKGSAKISLDTPYFSSAETDALITLTAYGVVENLDGINIPMEGNLRLLKTISSGKADKRRLPDLSYEDEIESLKIGVPNDRLANLLKSRYSLLEGTALEALSLMSSEYRS